MAADNFINIRFPFESSEKGYVARNKVSRRAIKSDLMHLLLTRRGERLYRPSFGTNLLKYLFDQQDDVTAGNIKRDIKQSVSKFIPNLQINEVIVERSEKQNYTYKVTIDYTITEDVFEQRDLVIIEL